MHFESIHKRIAKGIVFALFVGAAVSAAAQVVPAANEGRNPLSVGAGFSYFDPDWGHTRMYGVTVWADYHPPNIPHILNGLGIEVEARDVDWNQGDKPPGFREATGGGGLIYEWRHFRTFKPYVKGLVSFGGIDFGENIGTPSFPYSHDTRTVYSPGLGVEVRAFRHVWARVDYEYQFWPQLTNNTFLNPQGFTGGLMYDFRPGRRRRY